MSNKEIYLITEDNDDKLYSKATFENKSKNQIVNELIMKYLNRGIKFNDINQDKKYKKIWLSIDNLQIIEQNNIPINDFLNSLIRTSILWKEQILN